MTTNHYRFSMRTLIAVVSLACLLAAAFAAPRSPWTAILLWLLVFSLPGCLTLGIIYCRGPARAFFMGAIIPVSTPLFNFADSAWYGVFDVIHEPESFSEVLQHIAHEKVFDQRAVVAVIWLLSLFAGGMAAALAQIAEIAKRPATSLLVPSEETSTGLGRDNND